MPEQNEPPIPTHPCWLPSAATSTVGRCTVTVEGTGAVVATVRAEVDAATAAHGGTGDGGAVHLRTADHASDLPAPLREAYPRAGVPGPEGFVVVQAAGATAVVGGSDRGLLYGFHHLVRLGSGAVLPAGEHADSGEAVVGLHEPANPVRMLDHWDNVAVHEVMGQVERGYSGGSIFYEDGHLRADLSRAAQYARLLGSLGINRVGLNNVNVHRLEATLLTERLDDVVRLASVFRPHGIRVYLSVSFAAPVTVGGLATADPLDDEVRAWWAAAAERVYAAVPDFGGFVVKADSEGQPGPFGYGRTHADGANALARALRPHGGELFWRAFVYNHRQDWRDRSTDRARAAYDHFTPLDGHFDDNVLVQVKHGPIDFQVREPLSPLIGAMGATNLAVELQVTQEYTGQQKHVYYLGTQWAEDLAFPFHGAQGSTVAEIASGAATGRDRGGLVAVSNVGDDPFWTGHPLAQANLYAFGRLTWDPTADPRALLDEWISLTFGDDATVRATLHRLLDDSRRTYESYTSPLGVGFMVRPGHHYGPDVDGYEYTPWGTYHFADRDGVGVDRTVATGTGFTAQYPQPWATTYESLTDCPAELLLFFHHVPYTHVLPSGASVIQHIYDTRFAGVERVETMVEDWKVIAGRVDEATHARVSELLAEQLRSATEWRDQLNTYFLRKSGIPDAQGRHLYP